MRSSTFIFFSILLFVSLQIEAIRKEEGIQTEEFAKEMDSTADSVMQLLITNAVKYKNLLSSYEADIYIKGRMQIQKKNYLLRFAHNLFPVNRRESDMVFEMVNFSRFEAPNSFYHDYKAINGSSIPNRQKQREILRFLNLNIYSSTAFDDAILMPTSRVASKYYEYRLDSVITSGDRNIYVIGFNPKNVSQKLIGGTMHITDSIWTISKINISGRYYFSDFDLNITFGNDIESFNLPETADLTLRYSMLGNTVVSFYHSRYNYKSIVRGWDKLQTNIEKSLSYDLSDYYTTFSDSVPIIKDSNYWKVMRDEPLSKEEIQLYAESAKPKINNEIKMDSVIPLDNPYLKFAELMVNDINAGYKNTYIRYYGFLNPSELGYSETNGVTFRQRMRIRKEFANQKQLTFIPDAGFATRRTEVFLKGIVAWDYLPEKMAVLTLTVGNGNQSYSAGMMRDISQQLINSSITVEDLKLQYFHHYYSEIKNKIELFNGFNLNMSATYNHRTPIRRRFDIAVGDGIKEIINNDYNDFTTTIGFSYTPSYYYRMDKHRKQYLYSRYPTISIEFAKAFPGIWKSVGDYGKIEADLHQSIRVGMLQKLNYHVSAGLYTSKKSSYFTDFTYFARRNFPNTWDDQIGGVFNLLEREWFYASDKYAQIHLMYESPFLMLHVFKNVPRYVFAERIYFSQLWIPALPSYTEVGYGIGNHIFDIALFAGFSKVSFQNIGVKFAFELFR